MLHCQWRLHWHRMAQCALHDIWFERNRWILGLITYFACDLGHLLLCSFTNTGYATQEVEQLKRRAGCCLAHGRFSSGQARQASKWKAQLDESREQRQLDDAAAA
jgi:hypothetical protein